MSNGFTTEEIVLLIRKEMRENFRTMHEKLDNLQNHGCSIGKTHNDRLKSLEDSRKVGVIGLIVALWAFVKAQFL